MNEYTVLVAISVESDADLTNEQIEERVHTALAMPLRAKIINGYWIAEDERLDGTDNDSAVFVPFGCQDEAEALLAELNERVQR